MFVKPKDSRQRYTKQCLFDAFLKLVAQRPVSQISVIEICEDAGVSRKTFYKYYSDQFALLQAMQDDLFIGIQQQLEELPADIFAIVPAIFAFVDEHRVLIRAAFANRGEGNIIDRMITLLYDAYKSDWRRANPGMDEKDVRFLFQYVTSGLVGVIQLWLFDYPKMKAAEAAAKADYLMRLSTPQSN